MEDDGNAVITDFYSPYGLAFLPDDRRIAVVMVGLASCLLSLYGSVTLVRLIVRILRADKNRNNNANNSKQGSNDRTGRARVPPSPQSQSLRRSSRRRNRRGVERSKTTPGLYHRLILGISCLDIFNTVGYLLAPFLLPQSTQLAGAVGNRATCTTSGLMNQFVIGSYVYFAALSLYYLGLVRYNIPERTLQRYFEPTVHVVAVLLPLLQSIPAAFLGSLNAGPLLGLCAQYPHPYECYGGYRSDNENEGNNSDNGETTATTTTTSSPLPPPCIRGENQVVTSIGNVMVGLTVVFAATAVLATWGVWWTVRQQYRRSRRWQPQNTTPGNVLGASGESGSGGAGTSSSGNEAAAAAAAGTSAANRPRDQPSSSSSSLQARRAKAVAMQAVCYTLSVINLLFWFGIGSALEGFYLRQEATTADLVERLRSDNGYFVFMLCLWLGFPLQGLWNWIIYLRPRLLRWKDAHPELTWYGAYQQVLSVNTPVPTSDRTAHLAQMHVTWQQQQQQPQQEQEQQQIEDDHQEQEEVGERAA